MTNGQQALRIAFVPGVTVSKWTRRWQDRHPEVPLEVIPIAGDEGVALLRSGGATVAFVRLPVDEDGLSVIRLYSEVPVLVGSRDSEIANRDNLSLAEVTGLQPVAEYSPAASIKDAVALVAAGVGFLRLPHSLARLHARKDVVAVPIEGAVETEIALVWLRAETTDLVEEFVGIVRGRTAASSRSTPTPPTPKVRAVKGQKPRGTKSGQRQTAKRGGGGRAKKRGNR